MLDDIFVLGFAAYITELLKQKGLAKKFVPLVVLFLAAVLNVLNCFTFGDGIWQVAFKDGLMLGAVASGIYGFGQAVKSGDKLPPIEG